jgi:hypothetical protein
MLRHSPHTRSWKRHGVLSYRGDFVGFFGGRSKQHGRAASGLQDHHLFWFVFLAMSSAKSNTQLLRVRHGKMKAKMEETLFWPYEAWFWKLILEWAFSSDVCFENNCRWRCSSWEYSLGHLHSTQSAGSNLALRSSSSL